MDAESTMEHKAGVEIKHPPKFVSLSEGICMRAGIEIDGSTFFRSHNRWRCLGVGHYVGTHIIVKSIIGWWDDDGPSKTGINEQSILFLEAIVETAASLLDGFCEAFDEYKHKTYNEAKERYEPNPYFKTAPPYSIPSGPIDENAWKLEIDANALEPERMHGFIYLIKHQNGLTKIGYSKTPRLREKTLQAEDPRLKMVAVKSGSMRQEKKLHRVFSEKRIRGEWFDLSDREIELMRFVCGFEDFSEAI
jgi:hypothetical protein